MEKVDITMNVKEALEDEIQRLKDCTTLDMEGIYEEIVRQSVASTFGGNSSVLNEVRTIDVVKMVFGHYDVIMSKEERFSYLVTKLKETVEQMSRDEETSSEYKSDMMKILLPLMEKLERTI